MDEDREQELLLHVAAGTDLFTAIAATSRDEKKPSRKVGYVVAILIVLACVLWVIVGWL